MALLLVDRIPILYIEFSVSLHLSIVCPVSNVVDGNDGRIVHEREQLARRTEGDRRENCLAISYNGPNEAKATFSTKTARRNYLLSCW
jgi:hypothetical protein